MISRFGQRLIALLYRPEKVLVICTVLVVGGLLFDGTFFQLWQAKEKLARVELKRNHTFNEIMELDRKIEKTKDPLFLKKEALERFHTVEDQELLFLFAED